MKSFRWLVLLVATASAASVDDCPGYKASNVEETQTGLTADLTLAGEACNVYGDDLRDLKLVVEYQTSESNPLNPSRCSGATFVSLTHGM